ncbi:MAG: YraN family protein [Acidobacteriota bacterium]
MSSRRRDGTAAAGRAGEEAAACFLRSRGYEIVRRRYRRYGAEVDLVVRLGRVLAFVEVKLRRSHRLGSPVESVPPRKQARIARAAAAFLAEHPDLSRLECRFDLIGIEPHPDGTVRIEHLPAAFSAPQGG